MAWQIKIEKKAEKELNNIPAEYRKRILSALTSIARDPYAGKKLAGDLRGLFSYRIWPYRIIYKLYKKYLLVVVIRFGHRQGVYNKSNK